MGWLARTFWTLAAGGAVYVVTICTLTIPWIQRKATYAHLINPTIFQNLSKVDQFGFLHHQVQPFTFVTADNCTLFAWHILPAHLYRKHEQELKSQPEFATKSFAQACQMKGLQLLLQDPSARVVISFHGNAGHIGTSKRPATYQQFLGTSTPERPVHVIVFDYRGFGLSTGAPTEEGVIQDGLALLSLLTGKKSSALPPTEDSPASTSYLQPSQIILTGHSMGTFFSTAVFHAWTLVLNQPSPKGLLLFASFSSLTKCLESYSFKGLTPPIVSPLLGYPRVQAWFVSKVVENWDTASRLKELVKAPGVALDLTIMHAQDDWEIPWREGQRNWEAVVEASEGMGTSSTVTDELDPTLHVTTWSDDTKLKRVKWEKVKHGGHNRIPTTEHAKIALLDLLDR